MLRTLRPHIRPLQKPYPPIGVAGVSKGSDTLKLAGEHGFLPMSLNLNPTYVEPLGVGRGRRAGTGRKPAGRLAARARDLCRRQRRRGLAAVGRGDDGADDAGIFSAAADDVGVIQFLKHDPDVPDSDITPEYCARHNWLIGSPATVVEKIERMYDEVGGFGSVLLFCFDYSENPEAWHHSMQLLARRSSPKSLTCPRHPRKPPQGLRCRKARLSCYGRRPGTDRSDSPFLPRRRCA